MNEDLEFAMDADYLEAMKFIKRLEQQTDV